MPQPRTSTAIRPYHHAKLRLLPLLGILLITTATPCAAADNACKQGQQTARAGQTRQAIEQFDRCLAQPGLSVDDQAFYYLQRGREWRKLHHYEHAIADFSRAAEYNPRSYGALALMGSSQVALRQFKAAIGTLDRAVANGGNRSSIYFDRGLAREQIGQIEAAANDFDRAVSLDPEDRRYRLRRAQTQQQLGHVETALSDYAYLLASDQDDRLALWKHAETAEQLGRWSLAAADYRRLQALDPDNEELASRLANALGAQVLPAVVQRSGVHQQTKTPQATIKSEDPNRLSPPLAPAPAPTPDATVAEVQRQLAKAGFRPGPADGLMGPRTHSAIRAYQRDNGLRVDGRATASLLTAIEQQPRKSGPSVSPPTQTPAEPARAPLDDLGDLGDLDDF